jgi:hypothetical protein
MVTHLLGDDLGLLSRRRDRHRPAWRRWTKGVGRDASLAAAELSGDRALGLRVLDAVAIVG